MKEKRQKRKSRQLRQVVFFILLIIGGMLVLLIILLVLIILIAFYYISFAKTLFITKVPYVGSFDRQLDIMKELQLEKWKTIIDLGCGDGKALRFFAKDFWLKGRWYDLNGFAIIWWKILNKILWYDNIVLERKNFFDAYIKNADYIYLYLFPPVMDKVEEWIFNNKNTDTIIIVNSFSFPNKQPFKVIWWKIYLYK